MVDALGNLVRFVRLPGQRHDTIGVPPLIDGLVFDALLGDKAFDVDWPRAEISARGAAAVFLPKASRKAVITYDKAVYRWRHPIENYFAKIKELRAVATRYDKTDTSYRATINLAAATLSRIRSPMTSRSNCAKGSGMFSVSRPNPPLNHQQSRRQQRRAITLGHVRIDHGVRVAEFFLGRHKDDALAVTDC